MRIQVNGEGRDVDPGTTVTQLLEQLGLGDRPVAVERNMEIVPRASHPTTQLEPEDSVELVQFVGGG